MKIVQNMKFEWNLETNSQCFICTYFRNHNCEKGWPALRGIHDNHDKAIIACPQFTQAISTSSKKLSNYKKINSCIKCKHCILTTYYNSDVCSYHNMYMKDSNCHTCDNFEEKEN